MSRLRTLTPDYVRHLIDFAPGEEQRRAGFGEMQLEGCVAAFNMLARNRCAYLADEVGMGKTYVALGVMGLLRHEQPAARIVVIAPRENIQRKWVKELRNFVRVNWRVVGNRVKSIQGTPAWEPVLCQRLTEFGHELALNPTRDFFLRMTSFSLAVKDAKARRRLRGDVRATLPWVDESGALGAKSPDTFLAAYGRAFNALVPPIDLLVVDEAHNLKHGFAERGSIRNRMLATVFGHPEAADPDCEWYGPRVRNLLLLSATPFEEEYGAVQRQLDVFGLGGIRVAGPDGGERLPVRDLVSQEASPERKREILGRVMLRRTSGLKIGEALYTKNMYRREWRQGGLEVHDDPIRIDDPKQRLVVALVQKKVSEILQDERFNNSFQIGMLSSFESFLESVGRLHHKRVPVEEEDDEGGRVFDGDQEATDEERQGADSATIKALIDSYRERFREPLPHPKLDATAGALESAFESGEKALVFVRRVATVDELAAKLDAAFDRWLRGTMEAALPALGKEIGDLFERYERDRARRPGETLEDLAADAAEGEAEEALERHDHGEDLDPGSAETFFAWFFRGQGPPDVLSGAAFQRNRLASSGSAYSTLFEDDHVGMLLGRPADVPAALAEALGQPWQELGATLRARAHAHFRARSRQQEGYPRLLVREAYQAVALEALSSSGSPRAEDASIVLQELHREVASGEAGEVGEPPPGFPQPEAHLGVPTFFTELARRPELRDAIWPDEPGAADFRERFRRQEQRRELISALARLGRSFIDLYLLTIREIGGFSLQREYEVERPEIGLIGRFLDLLDEQRSQRGLHAFSELSETARAFDTILSVNFPEVPHARLEELAALFGSTLQRQVPVGRMSGGVNKRLVRQFRMPAFPVVLVTTDVLQEGEDLHTFCRKVVHYGISWTPSAMEQRTGRVDRIGGLVQRMLDGASDVPAPEHFIQVFYPHLRDTVEVVQVRRVLARLDRFLRLIHRQAGGDDDHDSRIALASAFLEDTADVPQIEGRLESAFPVCAEWLDGEIRGEPEVPDVAAQLARFGELWPGVLAELAAEDLPTRSSRFREAKVEIRGGEIPGSDDGGGLRRQRARLELRSQAAGDATLVRCSSPVGMLDLTDDALVDDLYDMQRKLGRVRVCRSPDDRLHEDHVTVESEICFHPDRTRVEDLTTLVRSTALAADRLEEALLQIDRDESPEPSESRADA